MDLKCLNWSVSTALKVSKKLEETPEIDNYTQILNTNTRYGMWIVDLGQLGGIFFHLQFTD